MVGGVSEDGPIIKPIDSGQSVGVSTTTLVELCLAVASLVCAVAMTWLLCRRRREHMKLQSEKSVAFRPPHRKPTAVKSPGSNTHYLKKSPSPTGIGKSPPGSGAQTPSPTGSHASSNPGSKTRTPQDNNSPVQTPFAETTLTIESDKAEIEKNEKVERGKLGAEGSRDGLGELVFVVRYMNEYGTLVVTVVKCKDLPARGQENATCDPYVKLLLLPAKEHRVKTRVLRNTRDPVYDEDFTFFGISQAQLKEISLHFIVLSFDRYSRDDIIGEVICPLSTIPGFGKVNTEDFSLTRKICPRSFKIQAQGRGELLVSLCWQPFLSRLKVVVLKARNLPKMDVTGLADPYVKIYLLYDTHRIAKKKTHVKKRTLNPVFNEAFTFEIPNGAEGFKHASLEFTLLDWDRVTKNEVIGRLILGGKKCQGSALSHWEEISKSDMRQIAEWHKLRE
ncbi:synaptotagmin-4 [Prorops nasuta]|uniref:synaptotagmin-4 n=1 Tax=Prorops nasuta TaxID=863751 RepID=UPI0034CE8874